MNGVYGTKRPANINSKDVDIFYFYRPTRTTDDTTFTSWKKIDSSYLSETSVGSNNDKKLNGMYDLRLPVDIFDKVGFYNIYIRPKEIKAIIDDISVLSAYPSVRGIVIDASKIINESENSGMNTADLVNGGLVGYRVEYISGSTRSDEFRIITSNNTCEPIAQNLNDGLSKGITYRFNNSSNLFFCTVTPSTSLSFNNANIPFIGAEGQEIRLINTKFNPISIEVEITDSDISGIATMLEGRQIRNLNKGIITTFNENGEIFHQASYGNIQNTDEGVNHDFKIPSSTNIDFDEETYLKKIEENLNE